MVSAGYIYILGAGGSGSTLLERILAGHSRLTPMGELSMMSLQFARNDPRRACSCGRVPATCPVWSKVAARVREHFGIDLISAPFSFRLSDIGWEEEHGALELPHWLLHYGSRISALISQAFFGAFRANRESPHYRRRWAKNRLFVADVMRELSGASAVIDNSKDYLDMLDLVSVAERRVAVLFLTRDVRGVAWSMKKRAIRRGSDARIGPVVRRWVRINSRALAILELIGRERWMHIRYEDICRRPQETVQSVCSFLGHDYEESIWTSLNRQHHTIGGNKMRRAEMSVICENNDWRRGLSDAELGKIRSIAARTANRMGYDLSQ
jgi:hypothetical protein